ncbi:MAG TPA: Flp pilus assembly protein CpaB [Thermoleophilaceae bacterium]|nr:Flp pilus assembly protein CpaB [Thermoleophilaceae bacterium]
MSARRRRGLLLLALALASGGLAASQVHRRERSVEERVGPLVPVVVAARDLPAGASLRPGALAARRVPARFVPPDALSSTAGLAGARTAVALAAGGYLTTGHLQGRQGGRAADRRPLGPGERALEVAVSGGGALHRAAPGTRVDVVLTTEPHDGAGRSFVALENVELLDLRSGADGAGYDADVEGDTPAETALAILRVTLRQAVYMTAADNFAREVRVLVRPPGDRSRSSGAVTAEGEL